MNMFRKYYGPRLTIDKLNDEGCLNMLKHFLKSLSREFTQTFASLLNNPNNEDVRSHYDYLRELITSEYFHELTNLDGRSIVKRLESNYLESLGSKA